MPSDTYILTISDAGVSVPSANSVTNDSVAADAAIAFNKLASLTSGNIIVGNSSNVPTSVAVTGDVTISNTGVTSIATGSIVNADINSSAGIAHSKLATTTAGNVLIGNSAGSVTGTPITGDISVSPTGAATINNNAVALSKLQTISDYRILGRNAGGGSGNIQTIPCTQFAFSLLDDGNAATARTTLGLGSMSTQNSDNVNITGGTISGVTLNPTTINEQNGGTGQSSYTIGDILYADSTTSLAKLNAVAEGNALISGGVGEPPLYGKIGLTTHVSGTLPVSNGGTGATTLTGYIKGDGTNPMTANPTVPVSDISGTLPASNGGTGATTLTGYVKGNGTSAMTAVAKIPASDIDGTVPSTPIDLGSSVGTLLVSNGGTGATTLTGYIKGDGTNPMTANPTVPVSDLSGTLGVSNGGTGVSSLTGYVKGNGTSAMTAVAKIPLEDVDGDIETPVDLESATGVLSVSKGGTGATTLTGYVKGNGTGAFSVVDKIPYADISDAPPVSLDLSSAIGVLPISNGGTGYNQAAYGYYYANESFPVFITENSGPVEIPPNIGAMLNTANFNPVINQAGVKYVGSSPRLFYITFTIICDSDGEINLHNSINQVLPAFVYKTESTFFGNAMMTLNNNDIIKLKFNPDSSSYNTNAYFSNINITLIPVI